MANCPADVVLIDALENPVKFANTLFRLGDFTPALLGLFFGFLKTPLSRGFLKALDTGEKYAIIKKKEVSL